MAGNERRHRRDIEVESVSDFISYVLKQENRNGFFVIVGKLVKLGVLNRAFIGKGRMLMLNAKV
ncbi:hypothetical protein RAM19_08575 [Bartonella apihabitans]|uniref:hypothetical protein n=1 Tax=uncultured Bartonella sp. TaxID=104108 RepID=UPI001AEE5A02|nr:MULTISPECIES: hypothetical protein [Bartonella]WLT08139.1 hypothetical protein RAM19_08575 [Bartonella apihabitans]